MRRRAFTLIELLAVIGIITVLVGILLPVITKARARGDLTTCRSNLRQIGQFFHMYLDDSRDRLPLVNTMPSVQPPYPGVSIVELLRPYAKDNTQLYRCPADQIRQITAGALPGYFTYFDREQSSYQYSPILSSVHAGQQLKDTDLAKMGHLDDIPIIFDYEPFHAKQGQPDSTSYLFPDGRVSDFLPG